MNDIEIAVPGETFRPMSEVSDRVGARAVNTRAGSHSMLLNSQWATRPDDQRFLDLDELYASVKRRSEASVPHQVDVTSCKVRAYDGVDSLTIEDANGEAQFENWSFAQLSARIGAPASYLTRLPPTLAGINLQYGLKTFRQELVKTYRETRDGLETNAPALLRAVTGPDYGRITDAEVVEALQRVAGSGRGEAGWKVPGLLDWSTGVYNPYVDPTKETTTLYASDRDMWAFMVDDTRPIEVGLLPSGEPDLMFRGFAVWNSEVGNKSLGIATMYLRAICCNRILWGVERFQEITMRHSKGAPERFMREAAPALASFATGSTSTVVEGVKSAKAAIVARNDDERVEFLANLKVSKRASMDIIETVTREEGKAPESIWDFVQGMTAVARKVPNTDDRVDLERAAGKLLDRVAKAN